MNYVTLLRGQLEHASGDAQRWVGLAASSHAGVTQCGVSYSMVFVIKARVVRRRLCSDFIPCILGRLVEECLRFISDSRAKHVLIVDFLHSSDAR